MAAILYIQKPYSHFRHILEGLITSMQCHSFCIKYMNIQHEEKPKEIIVKTWISKTRNKSPFERGGFCSVFQCIYQNSHVFV